MKARTESELTTPLLSPGDLVDEREAAAILNVEVRTLRNWRALGKGLNRPGFPGGSIS